MTDRPTVLYHYTCAHMAERIDRSGGVLQPAVHPLIRWDYGAPFAAVWLTDLAEVDEPARWGLGLTSDTVECDRLEARYVVPYRPSIWAWPEIRYRLWLRDAQAELDLELGRAVHRWYVTTSRIRATRDHEWTYP